MGEMNCRQKETQNSPITTNYSLPKIPTFALPNFQPMKTHALKRLPELLMLFFGISIFIFLVYKSATSSFTHDESFTYLHYPHQSFLKIISFSDSYTNNHILNTLFMKYSEQIFGNSELALRLPNLLSFLIYMFYSFLIMKRLNPWVRSGVFILLISNLLLIDLFGLARGYGISIGFMFMGLYHFLEYIHSRKWRDMLFFHGALLLAVLASFTMLTVYLSLLAVFLLHEFLVPVQTNIPTKTKVKNVLKFLIPALVSVATLYEPVRRVMKYNKMDFGGSSGFYPDTVKHLIINTFQLITPAATWLAFFQVLFTTMIIAAFLMVVMVLIKKSTKVTTRMKNLMVVNGLLLLLSFLFIVLHHLLGTTYPISRFSVFLVPLFIIHFGFFCQIFVEKGFKVIVLPLIFALAMLSVFSFTTGFSNKTFGEWNYDSNTKAMLHNLEAEFEQGKVENGKVNLGINWVFEPTVNFYRVTKSLDWLQPATREDLSEGSDYFYIFNDDLSLIENLNYEIIARYEDTGTLLIKNKSE